MLKWESLQQGALAWGLQRGIILFVLALSFTFFSSSALAQRKEYPQARQVPEGLIALPQSRFHALGRDPKDPLRLYAATGEGLKVSADGGLSWQSLLVGGEQKEVFTLAVHPQDSDTLFVGRRDGLWQSRDGGRSWESMSFPGSVPLALALAPSDPETLYLATSRLGVFRSTDGGKGWEGISEGLPEARAGGRPEEIRTLVVGPLDANTVYVALSGHGIFRTRDGGKSWQAFNKRLSFLLAQSVLSPRLAFDPLNPQRLYLAFSLRVHSHLIRSRVFMLSEEEWLPLEVSLPANFLVLDLVGDGTRGVLQLWGSGEVWEVPLPEEKRQRP